MSLPVVSRKAGPSWLLGRRIPMRVNLFLRSHTMLYTYCLLLLLAHRPDGSYYALWFLPRAAFWCIFAPPFAHARSQRANIVVSSYSDIGTVAVAVFTCPRGGKGTVTVFVWSSMLAFSFSATFLHLQNSGKMICVLKVIFRQYFITCR